jgi:hypothetical protein
LLAYAAFLDVMDVGQAKTRFFKRNSEKADSTYHCIRTRNVSSGYGYRVGQSSFSGRVILAIQTKATNFLRWKFIGMRFHPIIADAGTESGGQARLLRNSAIGLSSAAKEKRDSARQPRLQKLLEVASNSIHRSSSADLA